VIDLLYIIHLSFLYCSFVEDLKKNWYNIYYNVTLHI
jgi:hypothetical protein